MCAKHNCVVCSQIGHANLGRSHLHWRNFYTKLMIRWRVFFVFMEISLFQWNNSVFLCVLELGSSSPGPQVAVPAGGIVRALSAKGADVRSAALRVARVNT